MTERQKKLIALLKKKQGYTKQIDIAKLLPEYGAYTLDYHNSTARIAMTDDIREINSSMEFEGIILSDRNGIKLADRAECERKLQAELISILKAFSRVRKKFLKYNLDGQAFITDDMKQKFREVFNTEV